MAPHCTISRMKWYLISICLDRSWNTGFSVKRIPLWLSQTITVVSSTCPNNSLKSFRNQTVSQQAILAAMYSASAVLKATDFCFLLIHEIEAEPRLKQHPDVLLRSTTLPAQLASVYPRSITLSTVYLSPWFIVPRRYLRRFLAPT